MSDFIWLNPFTQEEEKKMTVAELFPRWATGGGLFTLMGNNMPWSNKISGLKLDILYFGSHSGGKLCAPFIKRYAEALDNDYNLLRENLPSLIRDTFKVNWTALWNTYEVEYNPLHNYDILEETDFIGSTTRETSGSEQTDSTVGGNSTKETDGTDSTIKSTTESIDYGKTESTTRSNQSSEGLAHGLTETVTHGKTESETTNYGKRDTVTHGKSVTDTTQHGKTETTTHGKTVTDTLQHGKTETTTHGKTTNDDSYRYGFNSGVTPEPSDKETVVESGTTSVADTGTDTDTSRESGTTVVADTGTDTTTSAESGTTSDVLSGSDSISKSEGGTTRNAKSGTDTKTISESETESLELGGTDEKSSEIHSQLERDITETDTFSNYSTAGKTSSIEDTTDKYDTTEVHRRGNIGVTTTQKLIQEEREVWLWNYFEHIFIDVDTILALQFHDPCRV